MISPAAVPASTPPSPKIPAQSVWGTARGLALLGEDGFLEDSKVQPSLDPPWDLKQEPKDQERTNEQTNKQITGAPVSQSGTMTRRGDISYNYGDPR